MSTASSSSSGGSHRARLAPSKPSNPRPAPPSILDRFRSLLAVTAGNSPPSTDEVVGVYEAVLGELTFNSKPVITELTIIAGEQRDHGVGIAEAICARILEAPVGHKLPSLYLLDSIVKNIGREYARYFAARLPEVFCEAYNRVDPSLHPSMRHLFGTWSQVFPSSVLQRIENELHFSSQGRKQSPSSSNPSLSESLSPRPGHGIHINPKYLEARQRLEQSTLDIRDQRGLSSRLDAFEQKASGSYGDYDFDRPEANTSHDRAARLGPIQVGGRSSAIIRNDKSLPHSKSSMRSSFPIVGAERHRTKSDWQERIIPSHPSVQFPNIRQPHDFSGELAKPRARELIDAYGSYKETKPLPHKPSKVPRLSKNGVNIEAAKTWKNAEEEEYTWESMSPTLVDRNRSNKQMDYDLNAFSLNTRTSLGRPSGSIQPYSRRSNWSITAPHLSSSDEPVAGVEDSSPGLGSSDRILRPQLGAEREDLGPNTTPQYAPESVKSFYEPSESFRSSLPWSRGSVPSASNISNISQRKTHYSSPDAEISFGRLPSIPPDSSNGSYISSLPLPATIAPDRYISQRPTLPPVICKPQILPPLPVPQHLENRNMFDPIINQGPRLPISMSQRPTNMSGSTLNPQCLGQNGLLQFQPRDPHRNVISSASQMPPHLVAQSLGQVQGPGHPSNGGLIFPNSYSALSSSSMSVHDAPTLLHPHGGALPPLPPGPPPSTSIINATNSGSLIPSSQGSGFSGLFNSLLSQGVISLEPTNSSKDTIGTEFDPEILKTRHDSAINDLYINLPRQCTTCGLRFQYQEEHSSHMDWHVTKNRMSRNRKQKPSRKWFVSAKEWLSGAETLGADSVPGFLPAESVAEKKEEEFAVPADENQQICALCGEPFEDFYSDEADEWMYKGAVYLNAPGGFSGNLNTSQLGPIVHAKCRPD